MANPIVGNDYLDTQVAAAAVAGSLATPDLHLIKSTIALGRSTLLADLSAIEANYGGYAMQAGAWSVVTISDDGQIERQLVVPEFRPTNSTTPNNIYGWYLTKTGTGELLMAGLFDDAPLPMASALDNIVATIRWRSRTGGIVNVLS